MYRLLINFCLKRPEIKQAVHDTAQGRPLNKVRSAIDPRSRSALRSAVQGFTLIETLIYVTIIGAAVGSFVVFALLISGSRSKAYVIQEVQANARVAMDLIAQKIRLADDVISPTEGNSADNLVLDMPDLDLDLTISVADSVLGFAEGVGDPVPVTSDEVNVSSLNFTNFAPSGEKDNIRIEIMVEYNNSSGDIEFEYAQSLQTAVSIRR